MKSIGLMTIRRNQELTYFTSVASHSPETVDIVRFTPLDIDPLTELIHGYLFDHKEKKWVESKFPIPDYIYDRCFYNNPLLTKKCEPIVKWLKQRPQTTFLGYGLPNKWEVYNSLRNEDTIAPYLPETSFVSSYPKLIKRLKREKSVILKPVRGSGGNGIIHIKLVKNGITTHYQHKGENIYQTFVNQQDFRLYIESLLSKTDYLGQKYLHLKQGNRPFDIRILLQKDELGQWVERGRGIRIGCEDGLVSNLQNGGNVLDFQELIKEWSPIQKQLILEEINTIVSQTPRLIEDKFGRLFELGLDIGVSENGAVWLLDINSKPGRKVIHIVQESNKIYTSLTDYMKYLESQQAIMRKE
ncbi:YheC/YheD family protein [Bacillus sp. BGMRC 2118]|nr:YheC/YheD family protein [Bacillus sp. BGMRC 2118]